MTTNKRRQAKKNWKGKSSLTTLIAVIVVLLFTYFSLEGDPDEESREGFIPVELVKTIDGDTIKIIYEGKEQNLRYLLIDTPELNHRNKVNNHLPKKQPNGTMNYLRVVSLKLNLILGNVWTSMAGYLRMCILTGKVFNRNSLKRDWHALPISILRIQST